MTKDYSVTIQDSAGRTTVLYINGASIDELGGSESAREAVESNAYQNAIAAGEIGEDAFLVSHSDWN